MVGGSFLAGFNGLGVSLGEMSGNDIAMSVGTISLQGSMVRACPLSPASSARWLPLVQFYSLAGFNGSGVSLVGGSFLAGVNGSGVSPLYCFPLQVRAVVAMVKFSHLTYFVLNKKLGCIIQNCSLGGCHLSPASSARWCVPR